jgi:DNA repair exonuclease SbcCD nuclease subunit
MSKTLIIGDLHINERAIEEIETIFDKDICPIDADRLIQLGDYYDSNFPSALELKFGTNLAKRLSSKYREVIILSGTGTHDLCRGYSVIEYLQEVKGVHANKGDFIEGVDLFCGHFMLYESALAFGSANMGIGDLSKYDKVFLGHQHSPQTLVKNNIYHLGSVRYCSFNEVNDKKHVVLLEDSKMSFIALKHCIPMLDVSDVSQLEQIDARTKVRVIFNSFEDYKKNASYVNKLGKKFFQFKLKLNFEESKIIINQSNKLDTNINKSNIIKDYITKIEDKDVRQMLEQQFKENI